MKSKQREELPVEEPVFEGDPTPDEQEHAQTQKAVARKGRIMYVESKAEGFTGGEAWIGRVTFSKTGRTLYYRGHRFATLNGTGFKANYFDIDSGDEFWISGPKKDGGDRLYGGLSVNIDEDVREEY